MPQDKSTEDAIFKAVGSFLVLWIAPALWPVLDLLKALIDPAHGIFEWLHKGYEVFQESKEVRDSVQEGSFFEHLKEGYEFALYFAVLVLILFAVISILSLISRSMPRSFASPIEAIAAAVWLIPYWIYKVVTSLMIFGAGLALTVGLVMGIIQMFRTAGFIAAVIGSMIAIGMFMAILATIGLSFFAMLCPPYLCLRYVVPFGLMWGQPEGIAARRFHSAFEEGKHFPFWVD